jgi:hypothetical protein
MYYGQTKKFIHYPIWSWDKVKCLLVCIKACERTNDMIIRLCIHQISCAYISNLHYLENYVYKSTIDHALINRDVQRIM